MLIFSSILIFLLSFLFAAHLPQNAVKLCVIVCVRARLVCVLLEGRVQRFDVCSWTIVGDAVEERAFEAELDAEVERSRAGDRSGLDDALQLY